MSKPIEEMSTAEVEREIAELVLRLRVVDTPFVPSSINPSDKSVVLTLHAVDQYRMTYPGGVLPNRIPPTCSDLNACHKVWGMLTPKQREIFIEIVIASLPAGHSIAMAVLDASADRLARWILAAARGGK